MTLQDMKPGYKQSPLGPIPEDWEITTLGKISSIKSGQSKSKFIEEGGKYFIVDMGGISEKCTIITKKTTNINYDFLEIGDLVMPKDDIGGGNIIGKTVYIDENQKYILGDHVYKINIYKQNSRFISYLINSYRINYEFRKKASGSAQIGINRQTVEEQVIYYPKNLEEQEVIVKILCKVDKTIEKTQSIIEKLKERNQGLEQELLTGKIRIKGFTEDRIPKKLGDVISFYGKKSTTNNEYEVLTSSRHGLVTQREYYGDNRLIARENIGFNIIPSGFITYRSRSDDGRFTFNINEYDFTGIVSKYYPVFTCKNGSNKFLVKYLNLFAPKIGTFSIGTSQLVLGTKELCNIYLDFPTPEEQNAIVQVLNQATAQLNIYKEKLEKLEELKKGLMQQLLTGKVRVKEFRN